MTKQARRGGAAYDRAAPVVAGWGGGPAPRRALRSAARQSAGRAAVARRRAGARRRADPGRGQADRGGGVHRPSRPRLARLSRTDTADRGDVRAAGAPLRLLHLRHALVRQRRVRSGRGGVGGAAARRGGGRRSAGRAGAPAGRPIRRRSIVRCHPVSPRSSRVVCASRANNDSIQQRRSLPRSMRSSRSRRLRR